MHSIIYDDEEDVILVSRLTGSATCLCGHDGLWTNRKGTVWNLSGHSIIAHQIQLSVIALVHTPNWLCIVGLSGQRASISSHMKML